ncbi:MAG: PQQ-binding-like beta-propeller repeat protein [Patescibacteria group bacterium]|nr:PQQ-binding-like beta-propeller repeat protein [Patescibacteria group bacterium]
MRHVANGTRLSLVMVLLTLWGCAPATAPPVEDAPRVTSPEAAPGVEVDIELGEPAAVDAVVPSTPATAPETPSPVEELQPAASQPPASQPPASQPAAAPASQDVSDASGPYWPMFQGPAGDNISNETGLLREWPEGGPTRLWTAQGMGEGYASVSLAGGLIYTAGNIDNKTVVTALDLDGKIRWQMPAGAAWTKDYPGTRSTPTLDGDRLYYQNPLGELSCLKAATGELIWQVNVLERFGAENIRWALAESPLIDGNRVISTPGGPKTAVVALDKMTGETVWQSESAEGDATGYATPTLAEYKGKRLLFTMTAQAAICVDADSGRLYWRFPHKTEYDVNATTPIFHDGHLFITSGYRTGSRMLRVLVDGDKVGVEEAWQNADLDNHHGGAILLGGHVYGSDSRRAWICLDWKDGRTVYTERGVGKGSLTYAEGMLYTLSENGQMGLVPATPEAHNLVGQFKLPPDGQGKSWAYPVVCDGRLYLRHGDFLYCYNVR